MANIAYRYRIYPTEEQKTLFAKTFGCCRKVWNLMLTDKADHYREKGETYYCTPAMYKDAYPYLKEVDSLALANVQLDLEGAFRAFIKQPKTGYPKYKSRHKCKASYTTNNVSGNIAIDGSYIKLPKAGKVKAVIHRTPEDGYKLKSVTVSMGKDVAYYASVLYEYDEKSVPVRNISTHAGLDYKSDGLFVASDGTMCDMPHFYRRAEARLRREQRKLSHMIESHVKGYTVTGSKRIPQYDKPLDECSNVLKQKLRVARLHSHVANQRNDFLQKKSAEITNQFDLISVESLDMKAMANKGFGNGKATMDNGYGRFLSMLQYKQSRKGHHFVKIDRWFPSSQLCSACGYRNPETKNLDLRSWVCPDCGTVHDRDVNAAINIDNEGLRIFLGT